MECDAGQGRGLAVRLREDWAFSPHGSRGLGKLLAGWCGGIGRRMLAKEERPEGERVRG